MERDAVLGSRPVLQEFHEQAHVFHVFLEVDRIVSSGCLETLGERVNDRLAASRQARVEAQLQILIEAIEDRR